MFKILIQVCGIFTKNKRASILPKTIHPGNLHKVVFWRVNKAVPGNFCTHLTHLGGTAVLFPEFGCVKRAEPYAPRSPGTRCCFLIHYTVVKEETVTTSKLQQAGQSNRGFTLEYCEWKDVAWFLKHSDLRSLKCLANVPFSKAMNPFQPLVFRTVN